MELSTRVLSDIVVFSKYAKHLEDQGRRENWEEICNRNLLMHQKKYPQLKEQISKLFKDFVIPKKVLMSMRSAQFGGKPIELSPNRIFNCCYMPINSWECFHEMMFLLLGGTGGGYSVQLHHIEQLPEIKKPTKNRRHVISDNIMGWSDAIKALIRSHLCGKPRPIFDYSEIRAKGIPLKTSGGLAPGVEPLKDCLHNLEKILDRKTDGDKLSSLEVHDMICFIADAVLSGGIRRAALVALFGLDDEEMLTCKFGAWWELNPQRGRANNSAVILRHRIKKDKFLSLWSKIRASGSGEPGIYFSNNKELGTNPCCEISLKPFQFCNLVEINMSDIDTQEELDSRSIAASFLGTLQAGYTDFHYLRDIWKRTTEKEALLGVSGTGIASGKVLPLDMAKAASLVLEENKRIATIIGVNSTYRATCIKPAGTTSLVLGSSSGIHAWFAPYYIRRVRFSKQEAIYKYLSKKLPELIEDCFFKPHSEAMIKIPIKAPMGAIFRNESALGMLERVKKFSLEWVKPGHVKGDNTHNVSATVFLKDEEWREVGEWMWKNRKVYNGLSVLPYDGGSYKQAPFEEITELDYEKLLLLLKDINLNEVLEIQDNTNLKGEVACAGGICEIA